MSCKQFASGWVFCENRVFLENLAFPNLFHMFFQSCFSPPSVLRVANAKDKVPSPGRALAALNVQQAICKWTGFTKRVLRIKMCSIRNTISSQQWYDLPSAHMSCSTWCLCINVKIAKLIKHNLWFVTFKKLVWGKLWGLKRVRYVSKNQVILEPGKDILSKIKTDFGLNTGLELPKSVK